MAGGVHGVGHVNQEDMHGGGAYKVRDVHGGGHVW